MYQVRIYSVTTHTAIRPLHLPVVLAGIAETYALLLSGLCFSSRASSVPYDMLWQTARYSCLLAEMAMPSKDDDAKVYWQPHNRRRNRTTLNDVPAYDLPVASSAAQFSQSTLLNTCSRPDDHAIIHLQPGCS